MFHGDIIQIYFKRSSNLPVLQKNKYIFERYVQFLVTSCLWKGRYLHRQRRLQGFDWQCIIYSAKLNKIFSILSLNNLWRHYYHNAFAFPYADFVISEKSLIPFVRLLICNTKVSQKNSEYKNGSGENVNINGK